MAKNVSDVGKKLDVVVDSLADLQSHQNQIGGKLDALQRQVSAMHDDVKRLTGRPVLEVMAEQAARRLRRATSRLPDKVFVEPEVCGPGPKEKFEPDGTTNPAQPVTEACKAFLTSDKNVLLLSGRVGSGKSTAMEKMVQHVLGEYRGAGLPDGSIDELTQVLLVSTLPASPTSPSTIGDWDKAKARVAAWLPQLQQQHEDKTRASIVAVLAALGGLDPEHDGADAAAFLRTQQQQQAGEHALWVAGDFLREFEAVPELAELTDTPFMVEIDTAIRQRLKTQARPVSEIKSQLAVMLDEETAEVAWALLRKARQWGATTAAAAAAPLAQLDEIQTALDEDADPALLQRWIERLHELAQDVALKASHADAQAVARELQAALRRPPTSRATVCGIFVDMWVEREAGKAAGQRGGVSSDVVRAEATEFALQLAVHLTSKSQVMLFDAKHSQLFAEGSSADVFFGKDDLTRSARTAAPLRFSADGAVLSFIHKTVQEHCAAAAVLRGLAHAAEGTLLGADTLRDMARRQLRDDDARSGSKSERRQRAAVLRDFVEALVRSPLGQLDLEPESAVRDFLADRLLEDVRVVVQLRAAAAVLGQCGEDLLVGQPELRGRLELALENLRCVAGDGRLPRRRNGTLLHEAAGAGADKLVEVVLEVAELLGTNLHSLQVWVADVNAKTNKGDTPLDLARQQGHTKAKAFLESLQVCRGVRAGRCEEGGLACPLIRLCPPLVCGGACGLQAAAAGGGGGGGGAAASAPSPPPPPPPPPATVVPPPQEQAPPPAQAEQVPASAAASEADAAQVGSPLACCGPFTALADLVSCQLLAPPRRPRVLGCRRRCQTCPRTPRSSPS